jgi:hypothetical protein
VRRLTGDQELRVQRSCVRAKKELTNKYSSWNRHDALGLEKTRLYLDKNYWKRMSK